MNINLFLIFACGFPGMLDYFVLGLVKMGIVSKLTEKRFAMFLYMYVRSPGIIYCGFLILSKFFSAYQSYNYFETFAGIISVILIHYNAQHYLKSVIVSYHNHNHDNLQSKQIRSCIEDDN